MFTLSNISKVFFGIAVCALCVTGVYADEIDDIQHQIDKLQQDLKSLQSANAANIQQQKNIDTQVKNIQSALSSYDKQLKDQAVKLQAEEANKEKTLQTLAAISRVFYTAIKAQSTVGNSLFAVLQSGNIKDATYQEQAFTQQRQFFVQTAQNISTLSERKKELEVKQARLVTLRGSLVGQSQFLLGEIAKANDYAGQLKGKIAELSARQQAIISARSGTSVTAIGSVPKGNDFNGSIEYKSQAPRNSFAVFTFGAYTHRKGMSQYGAKGRAEKGQNYKDILKAYYQKDPVKKEGDTSGQIQVDGYGSIEFETTYLYGLAEMPSTFPKEALKAQAVAARTYALRYKSQGKSICTTEACQVFNKGKSDNPPSEWKAAVDETRGEVLEGVTAFYASTSGGYTNPLGWDTISGNGNGAWTTDAYESIGGSPWFYKSWYRKGYSPSGDSCGRSHPWLSQEEFSDIVNAWIVRGNPNGADANRILPITINQCSVGGNSGDPYSLEDMRKAADNSGGAVTNISSVQVNHTSDGQTSQVILNTNRGTITISGSEFKTIFNLRAPGYISLPQTGFTFFNIEKT